jgi:hypothetical protein
MTNLDKELHMGHLEPRNLEDLKKSVIQKTEVAKEQEKEAVEDPRLQPFYTFPFSYKDHHGREYKGIFTTHILTIDERIKSAALEATISGGVNYRAVDPNMAVLTRAIAHMAFSISKKSGVSPANWADDFFAMLDPDPVLALYEEVLAHEAFFRGLGSFKEEGEELGHD